LSGPRTVTSLLSLSLTPLTVAVTVTVIFLVSPGATLPAMSLVENVLGAPTVTSSSKVHPGSHRKPSPLTCTLTLVSPGLFSIR
jgi:hypothetical protein